MLSPRYRKPANPTTATRSRLDRIGSVALLSGTSVRPSRDVNWTVRAWVSQNEGHATTNRQLLGAQRWRSNFRCGLCWWP